MIERIDFPYKPTSRRHVTPFKFLVFSAKNDSDIPKNVFSRAW